MRATFIVGRLIALPLRHKVIAIGIEVAFIAGYLVWARHLPPQVYTSSALLFLDRTVAAKSESGVVRTDQTPATELAESILNDDVVHAICKHLGLFRDSSGEEVARFRSSLMLSRESESSLRVTWRGADRSQTLAAANAVVAVLLTSWFPDNATRQSSDPAPPVPDAPATPITRMVPIEPTPQIVDAQGRLSRLKALGETALNDQKRLRLEIATTDQRLTALGEEARRLEATVKKANEERQANITVRQPLMAQLAADKKNLETLLARYTDAYPDVEIAQERIAEMEGRLAAMPAVRPAPDADQSRMNSVTKEINNLGAEKTHLLSQLLEKTNLETNLRGQEVEASKQSTRREQPPVEPQPAGQSKPMVSDPAATPAPTATNSPAGDQARVFKVLVPAARAQPIDNPRQMLKWLVAVTGPLCGIMYLLLAVWWFRAVRNVETLERILPGNIAYLGAIPGMNTWRHNP
jgi:hypothetical protein